MFGVGNGSRIWRNRLYIYSTAALDQVGEFEVFCTDFPHWHSNKICECDDSGCVANKSSETQGFLKITC
jgi:hypothetical protein